MQILLLPGKKSTASILLTWRAPASIVAPYAIDDARLPLKIFTQQTKKLKAEGLWDLFIMESKLIPMLLAMRQRGVRVDLDAAERLYKKMSKRQKTLTKKVGDVHLWNARELAPLFDKAGIKYELTPLTGAPSFTKDWLAACPHPLAKTVHEIRHLDKLRETFIKGVVLEGSYKGRIHCSFNQLRSDASGTISGRFSSSNPNLQQIPARTDEGKVIRTLFLPDEEQQFGATDFSQIEFRLLAATASTKKMPSAKPFIEAYNKDPKTDFHKVVAEMTGLPRADAKTITFAIAYGAGAKKVADQLGVDMEAAKITLHEYNNKAPFMRPLSNLFMEEANDTGKITTILGRVRRFNWWEKRRGDTKDFVPPKAVLSEDKPKGMQRAYTYRALNAYIQGSAADVMKKAMVDVWESGVTAVLGAPHLTVHDELSSSVPKTKEGMQAFKEMVHLMENAVKVSVPLIVNSGLGKNWGDAKP